MKSDDQWIPLQSVDYLLCFINFQVAQAQAEEASNMRNRLNDENYTAAKPSHPTSALEANGKAGQASKRSAADIAAEVADKLTASSSSQLIMSSVLSTFAAQEAKNAGLTKTSKVSNSFIPIPSNSKPPENSMAVSDPNAYMSTPTLTAPSNQPYQTVILAPQTMQSQTPTSQTQYHIISNPPSQQYLQPSGGIMNPYAYGSIPPLPPGPPPPPSAPHMLSPMTHLPIPQQQSIPLVQQPSPITHHHQSMPLTQQPPVPPSFRPLQHPGMVYYGLPHHSQ